MSLLNINKSKMLRYRTDSRGKRVPDCETEEKIWYPTGFNLKNQPAEKYHIFIVQFSLMPP